MEFGTWLTYVLQGAAVLFFVLSAAVGWSLLFCNVMERVGDDWGSGGEGGER